MTPIPRPRSFIQPGIQPRVEWLFPQVRCPTRGGIQPIQPKIGFVKPGIQPDRSAAEGRIGLSAQVEGLVVVSDLHTSSGYEMGECVGNVSRAELGMSLPATGARLWPQPGQPLGNPSADVPAGSDEFRPSGRLEISVSACRNGCCSGWPVGCADPGGAQPYVRRERGATGRSGR